LYLASKKRLRSPTGYWPALSGELRLGLPLNNETRAGVPGRRAAIGRPAELTKEREILVRKTIFIAAVLVGTISSANAFEPKHELTLMCESIRLLTEASTVGAVSLRNTDEGYVEGWRDKNLTVPPYCAWFTKEEFKEVDPIWIARFGDYVEVAISHGRGSHLWTYGRNLK